jgi:hypothetical protein
MILDEKGRILDSRNRKQRRMRIKHHCVFTKYFHSWKSRERSIKYYKEYLT